MYSFQESHCGTQGIKRLKIKNHENVIKTGRISYATVKKTDGGKDFGLLLT
jgi:hypothetical protein